MNSLFRLIDGIKWKILKWICSRSLLEVLISDEYKIVLFILVIDMLNKQEKCSLLLFYRNRPDRAVFEQLHNLSISHNALLVFGLIGDDHWALRWNKVSEVNVVAINFPVHDHVSFAVISGYVHNILLFVEMLEFQLIQVLAEALRTPGSSQQLNAPLAQQILPVPS